MSRLLTTDNASRQFLCFFPNGNSMSSSGDEIFMNGLRNKVDKSAATLDRVFQVNTITEFPWRLGQWHFDTIRKSSLDKWCFTKYSDYLRFLKCLCFPYGMKVVRVVNVLKSLSTSSAAAPTFNGLAGVWLWCMSAAFS